MKKMEIVEVRPLALAVGSFYSVSDDVQAYASCFTVLACIRGKEMAVA